MRRIFALFVLVLGTSCGGGGGGDNSLELIVQGLAGYDGTIRLESQTGQCEIDPLLNFVTVGEEESATKFTTFFGFITFDISGLPAGVEIVSAVATVRMRGVLGDNVIAPGIFGNVVMEHIDMGLGLDAGDMSVASLSGELVGGDASPTFLASDTTLEDKTVDLKAELESDVAGGRPRTSLRLRMRIVSITDDDGAQDIVQFVGFENGSGVVQPQRPTLTIRYREP